MESQRNQRILPCLVPEPERISLGVHFTDTLYTLVDTKRRTVFCIFPMVLFSAHRQMMPAWRLPAESAIFFLRH